MRCAAGEPLPRPAEPPVSRRSAMVRLARLARLAAVLPLLGARPAHPAPGSRAPRRRVPHPTPRADVTAERVLPEADVPAKSRAAYAAARAYPQVLDGLYCHCGCAERDGLRSLLSCFESRMPVTCGICRGEAALAGRLAARGESLAAIRAAVDKEYGD